ncbi:MAG: hypothetical protein OES09_08240 [Gammaproteobacteria bacterium]|nr:hypothetical protein [Gammaproteobacteria bacterium]
MSNHSNQESRRYGIRIRLSEGNPMRLSHLLGENWETIKWFDNEAERDRVFEEMRRRIPYYRRGDEPAQVLSKIAD